MNDKVSIKFLGGQEDSPLFKCPGVSPRKINIGDVIDNVSRETYDKEIKNDKRFKLVSEKPSTKGKVLNKLQKESEAE